MHYLQERKLHSLHLHFNLLKTIYASFFMKFPWSYECKKCFVTIKQEKYTCSKNVGVFFIETLRGWLEVEGGGGGSEDIICCAMSSLH